jgi:hypothetical protein
MFDALLAGTRSDGEVSEHKPPVNSNGNEAREKICEIAHLGGLGNQRPDGQRRLCIAHTCGGGLGASSSSRVHIIRTRFDPR